MNKVLVGLVSSSSVRPVNFEYQNIKKSHMERELINVKNKTDISKDVMKREI